MSRNHFILIDVNYIDDANERYVLINISIDIFHKDECLKSSLLTQEELTKFNYKTVGKLFNDVLKILEEFGIKHDQAFLVFNERRQDMVKTMLFPNMMRSIFVWLV